MRLDVPRRLLRSLEQADRHQADDQPHADDPRWTNGVSGLAKSTPDVAAAVPEGTGIRFLVSKGERLLGRGHNDGDSLLRHVPHRKMAAGLEPMQFGGGKRDRCPRCLPWET